MTPEEADSFAGRRAAYVHVPFCSAVCPYCDFAVVAGRDDLALRYIDAVVAEIRADPEWGPLDSVYLGGGTPSQVEARLLGTVLDALADAHGIAADAEISLEANPEDFTPAGAGRLRAVGFNRVSFGAQSFDPSVLAALGRRHRQEQISGSVEAARRADFANVSLDLIFGTPGETESSWRGSLESALGLEPDHLSCYALTVERGTALGRAVASGAAAPDPDVQAHRYEVADDLLTRSGMGRYEVSNWSRPGFECRYNLTVWAQGEYLAYGNGAHGYRDGIRYRNHRRIDAYLADVEAGGSPRAGEDRVSGWDAELDRIFVGLRRVVGVAQGPATRALVDSDDGARLSEAGVIAVDDGRLLVMRPLLTDAVQRSVLATSAPNVNGDGDA